MKLSDLYASLPWGLHDAYLEAIEIDWLNARAVLLVRAMMSTAQDMDQRARIILSGLAFCTIDPPEVDPARGYELIPPGGLWIDTGEGAANADAQRRLPAVPEGCFLQWFFVQSWNSCIHICARDAELSWIEPKPVPARAGTRALFPGDEVPDREEPTEPRP